ncbi:MAG TPA: DUF2911 domain-containing protein [Bryobacteraceae bacterium]|nr:DUF2911 domain-containing protein [Bryobacteraceae bacterium]
MKWTTIVFVLLLGCAVTAPAQVSPPAMTTATISGKKLTISYSAPSMRGRKIMGALVPYGRWWRTGADSATTFQTEADLDIGGLKVPKGAYTIYTLPGAKEWLLIINKQVGQFGTEYDQKQDLGRVKMTLAQTPAPVERFKIELLSTGGNKGLLKMTWERTEVSVPITVQ